MPGKFEDRRGPPIDGKVVTATITTGATTAVELTWAPGQGGAYMTFENAGSTDIHIVFGTGSGMGAPTATANAGLIKAGTAVDWYIYEKYSWYSALAITSSSTLRYWQS